jgi:hypothetical protein
MHRIMSAELALRYSRSLGATPQLSNIDGYFDFQQVEVAAENMSL